MMEILKIRMKENKIEDKVVLQISKLEDLKKKLEVVQKNRWWPIPHYSILKESYFIPMPGMSETKSEEGEKIQCIVQFK